MNTAHYHQLGAYKNATHTVSKTRQIVMLYDGTIRFLQQARVAMEEGRIEDRYHLLLKASNVISGLQGCLDFDQSVEMSTTLYDYYAARELDIFTLHRTNSVEACDTLIANLKTMREAWNAIDASQGTQPPASLDETDPSTGQLTEHNVTVTHSSSPTMMRSAPTHYNAGGVSAGALSELMVSA